jgi:hypothetical protein
MNTSQNNSIGLSELIEKIKTELLAPPHKDKEVPFLFVESVELELQVTVKRDGKAGVKVDVWSVGGAELGGGLGQDNVQRVKVKLSPLFDKSKVIEFYRKLYPGEEFNLIKKSLDTLKGDSQGSADDGVE